MEPRQAERRKTLAGFTTNCLNRAKAHRLMVHLNWLRIK